MADSVTRAGSVRSSPSTSLRRKLHRSRYLYALFAAPFLFYVVFEYAPMFGVLIAFKDIKVFRGLGSILSAPGVGFKYFELYLSDPYFWTLVRNTVVIQVLGLAVGFPAPIILALMLNEVRGVAFKRTIQRSGALPGGRRGHRRRNRGGERGCGGRPQRRVGGAGGTLRRDRRQHDGRRRRQLLRGDRRSGRGVRRDPAPSGAFRRHRPLPAVRLRRLPVAGPGSRDPGGDPAGGAAGTRGQAVAAHPFRRRDRARRPAGRGDRGRTLGTGGAARRALRRLHRRRSGGQGRRLRRREGARRGSAPASDEPDVLRA